MSAAALPVLVACGRGRGGGGGRDEPSVQSVAHIRSAGIWFNFVTIGENAGNERLLTRASIPGRFRAVASGRIVLTRAMPNQQDQFSRPSVCCWLGIAV